MFVQVRGLFLGIGGVIQIIGGFGKLPDNQLTSTMKTLWSCFKFINIDKTGARPGCDGTSSLYISVYWSSLELMLGYTFPAVVILPVLYFSARLLSSPTTSRSQLVRILSAIWYWVDPEWCRFRLWFTLSLWLDLVWFVPSRLTMYYYDCGSTLHTKSLFPSCTVASVVTVQSVYTYSGSTSSDE